MNEIAAFLGAVIALALDPLLILVAGLCGCLAWAKRYWIGAVAAFASACVIELFVVASARKLFGVEPGMFFGAALFPRTVAALLIMSVVYGAGRLIKRNPKAGRGAQSSAE